jgi:hypothetical protein
MRELVPDEEDGASADATGEPLLMCGHRHRPHPA